MWKDIRVLPKFFTSRGTKDNVQGGWGRNVSRGGGYIHTLNLGASPRTHLHGHVEPLPCVSRSIIRSVLPKRIARPVAVERSRNTQLPLIRPARSALRYWTRVTKRGSFWSTALARVFRPYVRARRPVSVVIVESSRRRSTNRARTYST